MHLVLVLDLSTEAFLAAFRRMCPVVVRPTASVVTIALTSWVLQAQKEYEEIIKTLNEEVINHLSEMVITWHFNALV